MLLKESARELRKKVVTLLPKVSLPKLLIEVDSWKGIREHCTQSHTITDDPGVGAVRGQLVAESFRPSVTTMVLWLQELGLDIGCTEISPRSLADGNYVVTARQLLPLPEAEEYLVKRRRKERAEETELSLNLSGFKPEERQAIEPETRSIPAMATAYWTGLGSRRALRWQHDEKTYSAPA